MAIHVIRARPKERLVIGLAIGLLLFIVLANILAQVTSFVPGYWLAAFSVALIGILSVRRTDAGWWHWGDMRGWPLVVALGVLTMLFALINRGLAIFDDYHNLPLVSVIAAGDIPPHFYLNPSSLLAYHYGLHILAAGLVRFGGMFPWSAFDLVKAFVLALTIILTYVWTMRITQRLGAAILGAVAMGIAGGTRWLLLFAPASMISSLGSGLQMMGSGLTTAPNLGAALLSPWRIDGGGPLPFPFAFVSSLFAPSIMSLGGSGVLSMLAVLVLLFCLRRDPTARQYALFVFLFGSLGLTAEVDFVLLWAALALSLPLWVWTNRGETKRSILLGWGVVLLLSGVLVLFQGGVLTELFRQVTRSLRGGGSVASAGLAGFGLHWPPAIVSAHFGPLSLLNPRQLLLALAEIGPVVLVGPAVIAWTFRRLKKGDLLFGAIGIGSILGVAVPLVLWYGQLRDSGRSLGEALSWWLLLGIPVIWHFWQKSGNAGKGLAALAYTAGILGGVILLGIQLIAVARPQLTYFVGSQDARISRSFWNRLEPGAQVFDLTPFRSVTLFGREATTSSDLRTPLPEWKYLAQHAAPSALAGAGFKYVYMDELWWGSLTSSQKEAFSQPCVQVLASLTDDSGHIRKLLDVGSCR